MDSELLGVVVIDKPEGMTSHDVVQKLRLRLRTGKIGHLGTLDPMATGVLPVCVGKATRLGPFFHQSPKEYYGEIRFGYATTTYDRTGDPDREPMPVEFSLQELNEAVRRFTGDIEQIPPAFSAKKIGGTPSYKFARRGKAIANAAIAVHIEQFEIMSFERSSAQFHVVCSPGTYVRTLAHDLGRVLGCGAHLTALRRTRSGAFTAAQAIALDVVEAAHIIPIDDLFAEWPRIEAETEEEERKVAHGNPIRCAPNGQFARIFNKRGQFIAVAALENGWAHPRVVLT